MTNSVNISIVVKVSMEKEGELLQGLQAGDKRQTLSMALIVVSQCSGFTARPNQ